MPKLIETHIGTMVMATDKARNTYSDWRSEFFSKRGMILVYKSEKTCRGKYLIRFLPMDESGNIRSDGLKTTYGDIYYDYVDHRVGLLTNNSRYYFDNVKFSETFNNAKSL